MWNNIGKNVDSSNAQVDISEVYRVLKDLGLSRNISGLIQDFLGNVYRTLNLTEDERVIRAYGILLSLIINRQVEEIKSRVTIIIWTDNPKDILTLENIERFAKEFWN